MKVPSSHLWPGRSCRPSPSESSLKVQCCGTAALLRGGTDTESALKVLAPDWTKKAQQMDSEVHKTTAFSYPRRGLCQDQRGEVRRLLPKDLPVGIRRKAESKNAVLDEDVQQLPHVLPQPLHLQPNVIAVNSKNLHSGKKKKKLLSGCSAPRPLLSLYPPPLLL